MQAQKESNGLCSIQAHFLKDPKKASEDLLCPEVAVQELLEGDRVVWDAGWVRRASTSLLRPDQESYGDVVNPKQVKQRSSR